MKRRTLLDKLLDPRYKPPSTANALVGLAVGLAVAFFATFVVVPNATGFLGLLFGWFLALLGGDGHCLQRHAASIAAA